MAVLHAVQERHDLAARAGRVGREQRVAHAGGDLVLDGPQDGLIVVAVRLHVGEGHLACGRLGAAGGAPQERDGLRAGAGVVGGEGRLGLTGGDLLIHGPVHSVHIVGAFLDIGEHARLERFILRDVLDELNAQLVGPFSHGLAVLGGKGAGIIRLGELVGRDEVLVELLLEGGEFIGDVGLGLGLQGLAGDLVGVGDVTAETLKREVIGILPVARIRLEAGNALPVALGILRPARAIGAEGVGLFSRKLRGRGADLITLVHAVDQHGIVRDKHVVGHVADADPAHGRGLDRTILEELEDLDLLVAGLADGGELVVAEHIVLVELAVGLDVGVERDELVARVKVGDGEFRVVSHERVAVIFVSRVQVVQAVDHALVHLLADAGIGRTEVDDVLCLVADERSGLLRHRDQVLGGDDVLIVQIDAADDGHVGLKEDHVVVELDGDILRAAAIFNVPDLVLVADEHAGGGHAAVILVDVEQQLHALARRRGLGQDDGRDVGLFNADALALVRFRPFGVAVRVGFRHLFVAVERFGRGDGHALFVRAELGVGVAPPA